MAILATERVLTLDYWKYAYHLQPGDYVFDRKGNIVKVTLVQEYKALKCQEVLFNDYLSVRGDDRLEFLVENPKYRKRIHSYKGKQKFRRPLKPSLIGDIESAGLKTKFNRLAFSVPTCDPIKLPTQPLSIPPFVFGFWFFSRIEENRFSVRAERYEHLQEVLMSYGYETIKTPSKHKEYKCFKLNPSVEAQLKPLIPYLVPENYLLASEDQRLELLRGIMQSKNNRYNKRDNNFHVSDRNLAIIKQIQGLCESLGIKTSLRHLEKTGLYSIFFKTKYQLVPDQVVKQIKVHQDRRYIKEIIEIQPQSCVHIETDGEDGTILVGEGFIACR